MFEDSDAAERLLAGLAPDPRLDIILADGGHDLRLDHLAAGRADTRIVRSRRGRGRQMNAGAAAARAPWLVFVHADSRCPDGWLERLESLPPDVGGGWFRFALDDTAWQARAIEWGVRWRVRLLGLPYGDQAIFVRRAIFDRIGGYRDMPLMEDVEFVRRLASSARCIEVPLPLHTSSRRWRRDGWFRRSARNLLLVVLYGVGVPVATLARWYHK